MFDFFDELMEFLSQIVYWWNWTGDKIDMFLSAGADSVKFVSDFAAALPEPVAWSLPVGLAAAVFDFIRGR